MTGRQTIDSARLICENGELSAIPDTRDDKPMIDPTKVLTANIDWTRCRAAERRAGKLSGAWTVKGTRIPIAGVIENYNSGYSPEELATTVYRGLPIQLAREIIEYAAERS